MVATHEEEEYLPLLVLDYNFVQKMGGTKSPQNLYIKLFKV